MATRDTSRPLARSTVVAGLFTGLLAVAALVLVACGTSTDGQATAPTDAAAPSTAGSSASIGVSQAHTPAPSSTPTSSAGAPPSTSSPRQSTSARSTSSTAPSASSGTGSPRPVGGSPVQPVQGADGTVYRAQVLEADHVDDCAAHSYGAPVIAYFTAHPCSSAARRLSAIYLGNGAVVILSTISVDCALGPQNDLYKWTGALTRLEKADHTGSINDLLREGVRVDGLPAAIPFREAFGVFSQDTVVLVADAWYLDRKTRDQDPQLLHLEQNLFPSPLTAP